MVDCVTPVHPHVCGENVVERLDQPGQYGSPPRVWGKLSSSGKTCASWSVHPHVCGENLSERTRRDPRTRFTPTCVGKMTNIPSRSDDNTGSPPRVWGKLPSRSSTACGRSVHPHVCGENGWIIVILITGFGSPPHVWGKYTP